MQIIGITGKSGACKSTIGKMLAEKYSNCTYVDVDKIGHMALKQTEIIEKITKKFGNEILDNNQNIDRKKLRDLVFSKTDNLQFLEKIIWLFIRNELNNIISSSTNIVILECIKFPLIEHWDRCDVKILVCVSDEEQRKFRTMERDGISEKDFYNRDKANIDYRIYEFDYIIEHNYQKDELEVAINKIYEDLILKRI